MSAPVTPTVTPPCTPTFNRRAPGAPPRPSRRDAAPQPQFMGGSPILPPAQFRQENALEPLSPSAGRLVNQMILQGGSDEPVAIGGASWLASRVDGMQRVYMNQNEWYQPIR